jgi:phosphoadenosine phosphosulfate reductase
MLLCNMNFIVSRWVDSIHAKNVSDRKSPPGVNGSILRFRVQIEEYSKGGKVSDASLPTSAKETDSVKALNCTIRADIGDRLRAAVEGIGGRIVFTTSFGIEDQLIAHHIFAGRLPIEVVTLDTGRLFSETRALWKETEERYAAEIRAFHPDREAVDALLAEQGADGFYYSKKARLSCCEVRKVEPLGRALARASAWITGLRADQSQQRSQVELAAWDGERELFKIAPLFDFTRARVVAECDRLGVPVNALHGKGFASIGCAPCTRAVRPGEPERAGRWWWENDQARECGLHVDPAGRLARASA